VKVVIGVMGGGGPLDPLAEEVAYRLGRLIAEQGWVLLNGGRNCGVMDASARGAHGAGGLVVGVLPDTDLHQVSEWVDVPITTGLRDARNYVNVLSSRVVLALPGEAGTLSEVALALKSGRHVVTVGWEAPPSLLRFVTIGQLVRVDTPEEAIEAVRGILGAEGS
jgi:uncharacterized protein (TIGR00725 family)